MAQLESSIVDCLTHPDLSAFERGVRALEAWLAGADDAAKVATLTAILEALNGHDLLGPAELSRRGRVALELTPLPAAFLTDLAVAARGWRVELKNAAASVLPPRWRRLVYERVPAPGALVAPERMGGIRHPPSGEPRGDVLPEEGGCRTVLLLGASQDHESNSSLLARHGFTALRAADEEALDSLLNSEVCGIVVARSWWTSVPQERHREVLCRLLRHSSFAWVRVDATGLCCPPGEIPELCRRARFEEPGAFEFACHDSCHVAAVDITCLERSCGWLSTPSTVRLCPAEIGEEQVRVLLGAAAKHVDGRRFPAPTGLSRVEASPLHGGRSNARIIRIAPDDGGPPLIAKIDDLHMLEEELSRFREFIGWWEPGLSPRLHFHAGTGLISFALVADHGQTGQPAPTLEERLQEALYDELWHGPRQGPAEEHLAVAIDRAVQRLQRLNARHFAESRTPSLALLTLDSVEAVLARGMAWTFHDGEGIERDVFAYRKRARRIVVSLAKRATVHGDVHLRNILVRDDRDPYFIDYACSGPGHPCYDLVRLESAVLFRCFRQTADERLTAGLLRMLLEGADESAVTGAFPSLLTSVGNRLAVRAAVRCREAALRLLDACNGTIDDYLAVKYIVACQALLDHQQQTGIVRSALAALGAVVDGRERWAPVEVPPTGTGHSGESVA